MEGSYSSNIFDAVSQVKFESNKLNFSECIWVNESISEFTHIHCESYSSLFSSLASVVVENKFFENLDVSDEKQILHSEQYGGYGIGNNGGGGRVGNIDDFQLKGIGRTPVIGDMEDLYCSSGYYPLYEAVTEVAIYNVVRNIIPDSVVDIYSLLYIGDSNYFVTAENNTNLQKGQTKLSISIRKKSCRIGHFFPAYYFQPLTSNKPVLLPDNLRVKSANRKLRGIFKKNEHYINYIAILIKKLAKQFAIAWINRVAHGALTPSNLAFDGKWLDLTNTSIVPDGFDYQAGKSDPPFSQEKFYIKNIISEAVYIYGKYSNVDFNMTALLDLYFKEYNCHCEDNICIIIGINPTELTSELESIVNAKKILLKHFNKISNCVLSVIRGVPVEQSVNGPIFKLKQQIFRSIFSENLISSELFIASKDIFDSAYKKHKDRNEETLDSKKTFLIKSAIKAYRVSLFSQFFYIGRVYLNSRHAVSGDLTGIQAYLNNYSLFSSWVYHKMDCGSRTYIFYSGDAKIYFDNGSNSFVYIELEKKRVFKKAIELIKRIKLSKPALKINFFDFTNNVIELLSEIDQLSNENVNF